MNRGISILIRALFAAALVCAVMFSCTTTPTGGGCEGDDCGTGGDENWRVDAGWTPSGVCTQRPADGGLDLSRDDLGITLYSALVKYDGDTAHVIIDDPNLREAMAEIKVIGAHVFLKSNITSDAVIFNVVVSGSTNNGSLVLDFGVRTGLYLNGVNIKNPAGPAINLQNGRRTEVHLVGGCDRKNSLEDGAASGAAGYEANRFGAAPYTHRPKGAFFSQGTLNFRGGGFLELRSKFNHAIVADEHIRIDSVDIVIHESAGDGIHANQDINLTGSTLQIRSAGDAIQNEREVNSIGITIAGARITAITSGVKSHGIASETDVHISGVGTDIKITATGGASKGIRARRNAEIIGGSVYAATSGGQVIARPGDPNYDPSDTTSSAAGIKAAYFVMSGGAYKTLNIGDNSKGLSIDGNAEISGGSVEIRSHGDGIKVDGQLKIRAGASVYAESAKKDGIDCGNADIAPGTTEQISKSGKI